MDFNCVERRKVPLDTGCPTPVGNTVVVHRCFAAVADEDSAPIARRGGRRPLVARGVECPAKSVTDVVDTGQDHRQADGSFGNQIRTVANLDPRSTVLDDHPRIHHQTTIETRADLGWQFHERVARYRPVVDKSRGDCIDLRYETVSSPAVCVAAIDPTPNVGQVPTDGWEIREGDRAVCNHTHRCGGNRCEAFVTAGIDIHEFVIVSTDGQVARTRANHRNDGRRRRGDIQDSTTWGTGNDQILT